MREHNALASYPTGSSVRMVTRTIKNKLIAIDRDAEFFDGDRENGYGGFNDDGRWAAVAADMVRDYRLLPGEDRVLEIDCEKGFLLRALAGFGLDVSGTERSAYAMANSVLRTGSVRMEDPTALPHPDHSFNLVIARGAVYTLTLGDAVSCLREIERVKKPGGHSFVTLAAWGFRTDEDFWLMRDWSLLGNLILTREEWLEVMTHAGYTGDYAFVSSRTLGLRIK